MTRRYRLGRTPPAVAVGAQWHVKDGVQYAYLPGVGQADQVSMAQQRQSVREFVRGASWVAVKVLFALIAIPLILIFAVASFAEIIYAIKW